MSTVRCWPMTQSSPALGINARLTLVCWRHYSSALGPLSTTLGIWLALHRPCHKVALWSFATSLRSQNIVRLRVSKPREWKSYN